MKKRRILVTWFVICSFFLLTASTSFAQDFQQPSYPKYTKQATITWWTWTANPDKVIAAFNKVYPNIKVNHPLIGGGSAEYNKLTTAIKAGTGAPDVVQIEYQYLPKFVGTGGILDISKYVKQYKDYFQPWTWNQVSQGNKIYAIPEDIGPLALLYRPDVFQKYKLAVPKTWDEFAKEAEQLHKQNPNMYMSYFPLNDGGYITGLLWQAGVRPFTYTSKGWKIDLNSPKAKQVINFWGKLIKEGAVQATNDGTPQWESNIGKGIYASLSGAAWSPTYTIQPYVTPATSDWNAADMPQWNTNGKFVTGNWGGSTNAVTTQTKYPEAAALFAAWINTSAASEKLDVTDVSKGGRGQVPGNKYGIQQPEMNAPNSGLNNQVSGPIFAKAASAVDTSFEWSPWTDYVYNQMTVEFTNAANGKETWDQALDNLQNEVTVFAKSSGYKVVSDGTQSSSTTKPFSLLNTPALPVIVVLALIAVLIWFFRRRQSSVKI
ncbi:extracellular solute-binding protein [Pullulanibacillus sp. KACC 23026]|uniref:ABC transporter substrate-binding protein n=1 Tax=Pullulanibacillus sp. KACC 23026 TaxID=3028315 RepID=UPI0023AEECF5|nr:extracellular solute-binding protein [Pullulanibacillus sp. KACC 23026]WEG14592.1 extracellular solute-binding protein [Pullulanibacillus sp. KACC 23026]